MQPVYKKKRHLHHFIIPRGESLMEYEPVTWILIHVKAFLMKPRPFLLSLSLSISLLLSISLHIFPFFICVTSLAPIYVHKNDRKSQKGPHLLRLNFCQRLDNRIGMGKWWLCYWKQPRPAGRSAFLAVGSSQSSTVSQHSGS